MAAAPFTVIPLQDDATPRQFRAIIAAAVDFRAPERARDIEQLYEVLLARLETTDSPVRVASERERAEWWLAHPARLTQPGDGDHEGQ